MINYSPIEYICIDIANCVGPQGDMLGDKDTFENRIQWVKDNVHQLSSFEDKADDKYQFIKAVHALQETLKGNAIGHTVALDAICSGISLMSAMTGCIKGCKATGLINTGMRPDAYSLVTAEMNKILLKQGLVALAVSRSKAKDAVN